MTLTSTNHGLSAAPYAPSSQRLARPCDCTQLGGDGNTYAVNVSGCFNDVTNTGPYQAGYGHAGIDFALFKFEPVYSMYDGEVIHAGPAPDGSPVPGLGTYVEIRSVTNEDHNSGFVHRYGHLNSEKSGITKGTTVEKGDVIGYCGDTTSTGNSVSVHLHVELL